MKKQLPALLFSIFFCSSTVFASKIQVIGTGEVFSMPDNVSFSLQVESRCYASLKEANETADKIASDLFNKLNSIFTKKDDGNQIIIQGGYTLPFFPPRPSDGCTNTFQKVIPIVIVSSEIDKFESLFNATQNLVYDNYNKPSNDVLGKSRSFVTLSQPMSSFSRKKKKEIEFLLLDLALNDATEKAKKLVKESIPSLKIIEINETLPQENFPRAAMARTMMADFSGAPSLPIAFEKKMIDKSLSVLFEY